MFKGFKVSTKDRFELINITKKVEAVIRESGAESGLIFIFVPHSTAAIILTEDEPGLKKDWLNFLKKMVSGFDFLHNKIDNNAESHILSGLIGQGRALLIESGQMVRGNWQEVFLVELDGPRIRKVEIKIIKE